MAVDEITDRIDEHKHYNHRHDHGCDHDTNLFHHAYRCNHRVEGKHNVQKHDLNDHTRKICRHAPGHFAVFPFQLVMDFKGAFANQEEPAQKENQVLAGDREVKMEDFTTPKWLIQAHDPRNAQQQQNASDQ